MAQVSIVVGLGFEPPIAPDDYQIGGIKIRVSYPRVLQSMVGDIHLQPGASSVFEVFISDKGEAASYLNSGTHMVNEPIHIALNCINQLLSAFAYVRVGHVESGYIKTVGIGDTLFYYPIIDGHLRGINTRGKRSIYQDGSVDPCNTTKLALPFLDPSKNLFARRYVRCFELEERGFFQETIIIAFSIIDDAVQEMIHSLLAAKGLVDVKSQKELTRAIKESRLKVYLGPLLKILFGKNIVDMWASAAEAIDWLNSLRNNIAHNGGLGDRDSACKAIFVSLHLARAFQHHGLISDDIPVHLYRNARIKAAWTKNPPSWVPKATEIDKDPFTGAALTAVLQ